MPTERIDSPIAAAIRRIRAGSKVAPHARGVGKMVACQAVKPVRHSSWARAGMPNRLAAATFFWKAARARAPSVGSTGAVPKGRVSWPRPWGSRPSRSTASETSCWNGATSSPSASEPGQMLESWASFSSSVIRDSRSAARSSAGREVSCQGW